MLSGETVFHTVPSHSLAWRALKAAHGRIRDLEDRLAHSAGRAAWEDSADLAPMPDPVPAPKPGPVHPARLVSLLCPAPKHLYKHGALFASLPVWVHWSISQAEVRHWDTELTMARGRISELESIIEGKMVSPEKATPMQHGGMGTCQGAQGSHRPCPKQVPTEGWPDSDPDSDPDSNLKPAPGGLPHEGGQRCPAAISAAAAIRARGHYR